MSTLPALASASRLLIPGLSIVLPEYDTIDDRIVWNIIEDDLDSLIEDVEKLQKLSS